MKRKEFLYEVKSAVTFSREEVTKLIEFALRHYDGKCRSVAGAGGFLYGIHKMLDEDDEVTALLTRQQLDTLCKITEPVTNLDIEKVESHWALRRLLAEAGDEYERANADRITRVYEEELRFVKELEARGKKAGT